MAPEPEYLGEPCSSSISTFGSRLAPPARQRGAASTLLASPTIASKRWVYRQYDHMVPHQHARPARSGRRRRAHQGHRPRAGDVGGRQRPVLLSRPVSRRDARRGRGGAQRGVRRRPADRRDQLPQLRQSGAAGDHVAVRRRRSKASARRAARSTSRSPAATSASTTRPTAARLPDAGHRRRRPSSSTRIAWSAALFQRGRATPSSCLGEGSRRARRQRVSQGDARSGAWRAAGARPWRASAALQLLLVDSPTSG